MDDTGTKEWTLIDEKQKEMKPIFDRMDKDEDLYLLDPFKMKKLPPRDTQEEKDVANVTFNDPLLFTTKSMAIIGGVKRQTVIEGENLPEKQPPTIEQFLDDILYVINERLNKRGITSLDSFINEQILVRGRISARCCLRWVKDKLIPDVLPNDTRHFLCENDAEDMVWGAALYRRPKSQIEKEYGDKAKVSGTFGEIRDYWDGQKNVIFVDKKKIEENPNKYGYPPFVLSICPVGSELNTEDAFEHQGESIFWADRDLWPVLNETGTILRTLTIKSLRGALQLEMEHPETATKPAESPHKMDTVHPVEKGGGYRPMPINDIKSAARLFYSILEGRLQRGSLTSLDYGNLTFPLSAVAYTEITSGRDDIYLPRIQAIAVFYQALSRMIIKQCIAIGKTLKLGQSGSQNSYSVSDLKGDYTIGYHFRSGSKQQTAADLSIAAAARGFLPDDYIRREIMQIQDPDGMEAQLLSEQAERIDEVLFLYRRACALLDEAETKQGKERQRKEFEASLLGQRIVTILRQRQSMGELSPIEGKTKPETPESKELLPLFAGRRGQRAITPTQPMETEEKEVERV